MRARQIPNILDALRFADRKGVLVVGAAGNEAARAVAYPARAGDVVSVGAMTEHGCVAEYSNCGPQPRHRRPGRRARRGRRATTRTAARSTTPGRDIFQLTFTPQRAHVRPPGRLQGTSMAAPHVSRRPRS